MALSRMLLGALLMLRIGASAAELSGVVPPVEAGRYAVACSNVAQNFGVAPTDDARMQYWEGHEGRYVTDLLSEPQGALLFDLPVPDDTGLFPNLARRQIPYAALVCYPTAPDNPRLDYPIDTAGSRSVPKMQRGSERPLWADAAFRYPVILYSHGLDGSPLSGGYLETIATFASYGYVVAAPFHGDSRFADIHYDGLSNLARLFLLGGFDQLTEMQAVRPHSLRVLLDALLSHPDLRDHIDPGRIAGFGASLGGESLLLFSGAELTTSVFPRLRARQVMKDERLIATVGYVPYFGQPLLPAFGDDQGGLRGITMPFLAISGTADTTAPIGLTAQGVNNMGGSRYLVAFNGLEHGIRAEDIPDIFTWSLTFFAAHLSRNMPARSRLAAMNQVSGGAADSVHVSYTTPPTSSYQGLWLNPNEAGWAMTITQHENSIFAALGTFDQAAHPIWYVMSSCPIAGNACTGHLYQVTGGSALTAAWNSSSIVVTKVGAVTFAFTDANNGSMSYSGSGVTGNRVISRLRF